MDFVCFVCFIALSVLFLCCVKTIYIVPVTAATFLLLCKTIMHFKKRGLFIKIYSDKTIYDYSAREYELKNIYAAKRAGKKR
jgi:hypothetical protein